jgi:DNA mismatch endonuclease, patch repair protein
MRTRGKAFDFANVPEDRRAIMAKVRRQNTAPELKVRSVLHRLGFRYVLHDARLPGKPDLAFPSRRVAIFVHGCFWHRHDRCRRAAMPKARSDYWRKKFDRNVERDRHNHVALRTLGWRVIVVWECELKATDWISRVRAALNEQPSSPATWKFVIKNYGALELRSNACRQRGEFSYSLKRSDFVAGVNEPPFFANDAASPLEPRDYVSCASIGIASHFLQPVPEFLLLAG